MAASTLASMLFDTWYGNLAKLPDSVQILPAHGAGSLCGAHLSDAPTSNIGAERNTNPYFIMQSLKDMIQYHGESLHHTIAKSEIEKGRQRMAI